jgi:hypothetical protein
VPSLCKWAADSQRIVKTSVESLGVGGALVGTPGLGLLSLVILSTLESLHGVGDGGLLGLSLIVGGNVFLVHGDGLLGLGVSVHEEIDHDGPFLVAGNITTELEDLAGEEPEAVGDGVATLVVGGDGDINPVEGRVGVAKSNHGDVHVGGFGEALVVEAGIADDDEAGLKELLGVLIGKSSGNPLSTEVVGFGVGGELEDSALGVLAGRHNLKGDRALIII